MTPTLHVLRAGPCLTIQDLGWPHLIGQGLSTGGAADRLALFEAAALLGSAKVLPAIEMMGLGGTFQVNAPVRFALTGAPMRATLDNVPLDWHRTHHIDVGQTLVIGAAQTGNYGYLTPANPISTPAWRGSQSTHLLAGIGSSITDGATIDLGVDPTPTHADRKIDGVDRFSGGPVRVVESPQSQLFTVQTMDRFWSTKFHRAAQANRQGVKLDCANPFVPQTPKGLASEFIQAGDIQMTGTGVPYVLLSECQTIGGYPRIATVIPADLGKIAQAPVGAQIMFERILHEDADRLCPSDTDLLALTRQRVQPCVRDPRDMQDLLSYQLISGMITGREDDEV